MTTANWEEQQANKTMGQLQLFVTKNPKQNVKDIMQPLFSSSA